MTTQNTQALEQFAQTVGSDIKQINGKIGRLESLSTENKESLVAALNELIGRIQAASESGGAKINDQRPTTTTVYSGRKVNELIASAIQQAAQLGANTAKNAILGGEVAENLDTLREIAAELTEGKTIASGITTTLTRHGQRLDAMENAFNHNLVEVYRQAKTGE